MPSPHVVSDENRARVLEAAKVGMPFEDICALVGITSPNTLKKYYRVELDHGRALGNIAVAGALHTMATSGREPSATMFWAKTRMRESFAPPEQVQLPQTVNIFVNTGIHREEDVAVETDTPQSPIDPDAEDIVVIEERSELKQLGFEF